MRFTKMHGLGNDFILVAADKLPGNPAGLAVRLCRRRFGVGADGLVFLLPSSRSDAVMRIFNADGSEAGICGNALRCAASYLRQKGVIQHSRTSIETGAGVKKAVILQDGAVRVDMGEPVLASDAVPVTGKRRQVVSESIEAGGREFLYTAVSMGNPHCVIFLEPGRDVPVERFGPLLECHEFFPQKANVEFCRIRNRSAVDALVWERGAGETLACGTGACAVVVAGVLGGHLDREAVVHLPGGSLKIEWSHDGSVYMEGPAAVVFEGELELQAW